MDLIPHPFEAKGAAPTTGSEEGRLFAGGLTEVQAHVKFFFEQIGAALGVAKIFGDIAAGLGLKSDRAALKSGSQALDTLAMRVIQAFGDTNNGGQAARQALVIVIQGGVSGMMAGGF